MRRKSDFYATYGNNQHLRTLSLCVAFTYGYRHSEEMQKMRIKLMEHEKKK